jgi:DNA repair protein RecO (recombination protein O)
VGAYTADAVILRARDFQEADRLLTLYTLEEGKVTAKVRGARKPKSRLAGATLPLTHVQVMLWRGRSSIETLTQAVPKETFAPLREDVWRLAHASLVVEVVDFSTVERASSAEVFVALLETLALVAYGDAPEVAAYGFALRLLRAGGLLAPFDRCGECGRELAAGGAVFTTDCRMLCEDCGGGGAGAARAGAGADGGRRVGLPAAGEDGGASQVALRLRGDALQGLKLMMGGNPRALAALRLGAEAAAQVRMVVWDALGRQLERRPRSLDFLDTLAKVRAGQRSGEGPDARE